MKIFLYTIFLILIITYSNIAGELEGGIFNNGSTLQIKMKPTTDHLMRKLLERHLYQIV